MAYFQGITSVSHSFAAQTVFTCNYITIRIWTFSNNCNSHRTKFRCKQALKHRNVLLMRRSCFWESSCSYVLPYFGVIFLLMMAFSRISNSLRIAPSRYPSSLDMSCSSFARINGIVEALSHFSLSIIWMDNKGDHSLLPVDVAIECMKQMGVLNLKPLQGYTSWNLIISGIHEAIFSISLLP